MDGDDCLLYVPQCGLAQATCRQQDLPHHPPMLKPQRQTVQFMSFPWCAQPRRPRFSNEKIHTCDWPGCGKSFYERCTLLRHQSLKHGRKAKFSRSVFHNLVHMSQNAALSPSCDASMAPLQEDVLAGSYIDALAPSRNVDLPPSTNDTFRLSQNDTLPLSQNETLPLSHNETLPLSLNDTLPLSQNDTLPLSQNDTLPLSQNDTLPLSQDNSLPHSQHYWSTSSQYTLHLSMLNDFIYCWLCRIICWKVHRVFRHNYHASVTRLLSQVCFQWIL